MKRIEWMLSFGLTLLALFAVNAYAESPREEFKQMVEQLQKSPDDSALREKIIKLAQELKPAPAVPEEAEKHEGRGQFAFSHAKSLADYVDAAQEYEMAISAAPWIAGYYSDLCTIYQKAEKFAEAKRNCEFYLLSSPIGTEASDARKRIAGLEFAIEKANSPEAQAAKRRQQEQDERRAAEEMIRGLEGATFVRETGSEQFNREHFLRIRGGQVEGVSKQIDGRLCLCNDTSRCNVPIGTEQVCWRSNTFKGRIADMSSPAGEQDRFEIVDDGRVLIMTVVIGMSSGPARYVRQ